MLYNKVLKLFILMSFIIIQGCAIERLGVKHIRDRDYQVQGHLDREYDEIIRIVKSHPDQTINFYASSRGGTSHDLFDCMDALYQHGQVYWYSLDRCDSACAVLALSTKHAQGHFRLHSFYRHHNHHAEASPAYNHLILDHLGRYGYDTTKLDYMFHSVEELWDITLDDGKLSN
jgi:hypothetical protein